MPKRLPKFLRRVRRSGATEARAATITEALSLVGSANLSGVPITERSALTLTAAFACINVIATDVSALPLRVYRRRKGGGRDEATDHPATPLLRWSPDGETTTMRARQAWMGHALGWGNGYQEIERDGAGRPAGLHRLDPSAIRPKRRKRDGRLYYELDSGGTLRPENVLHLAGLGYDGLSGYSPVRLARQAIGLGLAAETFGAALFGNGSTPRGVLEHPKSLTKEAAERLREGFERIHGGPYNAHRVAVLEEGMKWNPTSINPDDAQFLATRQFQVIEVARIYRVPPHKIGDYSQSHLANIEASNLDYLMTTLMPWCEAQEQEMNLKLLTAAERASGYYIEHALAAILRGDMRARAEFYTKLRDLGVLTPNLICEFENLNPIGPDGDIRLVPLNMTTLENAGRAIEPPAPVAG